MLSCFAIYMMLIIASIVLLQKMLSFLLTRETASCITRHMDKKPYRAMVQGGGSFAVIATSPELAYAEAVNCAALLFLEYGIVVKIDKVVEQ